MKRIPIVIVFLILVSSVAYGQQNYLITGNSAGNIKLGMTVAQARKAMKSFGLRRITDGDGAALIEVRRGGKEIMTLYAGEENPNTKINERAKIEQINVWDSRYRTSNGVHPDMLVRDAERVLGKVKEVFMSEFESREYAVFRKMPKGLLFRIDVNTEGKYFTAGIYPNGERRGTQYVLTAYIIGIQISDFE